MSQENVEIMRHIVDLANAQDVDGVLEFIGPDIEIHPASDQPETRVLRGRQAYADYARGNADRALQELEDFIRLHPGDDLADDAEFMVGEVYFSQQKYQEAVAAYDRLLKEHAAGDKAASAYLKKGLALLEMNRTADAVIQLQHVVTAFPKSDEARIARERLKALGLRER